MALTPEEIAAASDSQGGNGTFNSYTDSTHHPYPNEDDMRTERNDLVKMLNPGQRQAYDKAINIFDTYKETSSGGTIGKPLSMFLSGEGGTGKSVLIKALTLEAKVRWGRTEGYFGPVAVVGPTGVSAHNVRGATWHSVFNWTDGILSFPNAEKPADAMKRLAQKLKGLRLILFDEVSMLSWQQLHELHYRCHMARDSTRSPGEPFANLHIMFAGDFYQLPPVCGQPLYGLKFLPDPASIAGNGKSFCIKVVFFIFNVMFLENLKYYVCITLHAI